MSAHDFSLFTVLIVEDCAYMRRVLSPVLRAIGVGSVLRAANGAEAIEMLNLTGTHPKKVGASSVGIVMSNWMMDPVNGLMLLRWLLREINAIAHEMKGQGDTLGYPFFTTVGKSLYDFHRGHRQAKRQLPGDRQSAH